MSINIQATGARVQNVETSNETLRRAVVASTIGTVIEWFDYALYGAAAGLIINRLFFPQLSATAAILASFATFAVGFFARPVGGIVISHFGDRFGRKPALIFTIALMGLSTVAMGLLPTFATAGVLAPALLVFFRLVQGFGAGAEFAGAVTLVAEYAPPQRKAYYTAFIQSATVLGIMLATLCFLLVSYLPEDVLLGWAWRVPFLVSALLFVVALYIRKRLDETPEYVQAMAKQGDKRRKESVPIGELLRKSPKEVLFGFLSVTGHNANAYILSAFCLSYMTNTLHMARTDALTVVLVSSFVGVMLTPVLRDAGRPHRPCQGVYGWRVLRAGFCVPAVRTARHEEPGALQHRHEPGLRPRLRRDWQAGSARSWRTCSPRATASRVSR